LQIEEPAISSVTKPCSLTLLLSMSDLQKFNIRRMTSTQCVRCGAALPPAASTGRPRVFCGPACRKAAYDDRRARKPEAFHVRIIDRTVVKTVEKIRTIDEGHDITECVRQVCGSPRAIANVLVALNGLVRSDTLLLDNKWAPAVRLIVDLNRAIQNAAERASRPRR
jgi:ribosomal protein L40E